jgi:glutathione S-transferase
MITLYGTPKSSAGRCLWMLEEANVPYTLKELDMKNNEHKSLEFLKISPNGKVPALTDGEVVLFESMAINFYLAEAYKKEFLGATPGEKGLVLQWSFWASSELQGPIIEVFIQKLFMPDHKRDMNVIESNLKKLPELFKLLDDALAGKKYLLGNQFTLADLNTASVASISMAIQYDMTPYKNVLSWLSAMNERPAFQKYQALRK